MPDKIWKPLVAILFAALIAWLGRYSLQASGERAYLMDRWTGVVVVIYGDQAQAAYYDGPKPKRLIP